MKKIKPFLIAATFLMCVAFAWGITNFAIAEHNGTNKKLYHTENKVFVAKDSLKNIEFEDFSRKEIATFEPPKANEKTKKIDIKKTNDIFKINFPRLSYKSFSRGALIMPKEIIDIDSVSIAVDTIATKIEVNKADTLTINK